MYDFILFEQLYTVQNHYKDLINLASLLKDAGYKVAFADAFKEAELCKVDGIPHISLDIKCPREFKEPQTFLEKKSYFKKLFLRIRKDIYLYKVIECLNEKALNIYAGSMTLDTPMFFMRAFRNDRHYYMWALRSSNVLIWRKGRLTPNSIVSKSLYNNIHKYDNLRLVVSNELIKEEFQEQVGIKSSRLILRPERVISKKNIVPGTGIKGKSLNLLFIGTLRPFKNVEFCLEALKKLNNTNITYTIAGRCKLDRRYNEKIGKLAAELSNVRRIDRYIPDDEYEKLMSECDFLLLGDKTQESCASNGTMTEALLHGKPIIAPNFNPFKYEVEKYNVGLLYEYCNIDSLCDAINLAMQKGAEEFRDMLLTYQEMFLREKIVNSIKEQIGQ